MHSLPSDCARRGEADTKTIVIIVLAIVGVLLLLTCGGAALFIFPAMQQSSEAARRVQSANNLRQIGIGLHNYHNAFSVFPPSGILGEDGAEHVSWQTMLLPQVEQQALYDAIDTHVSWTDPVNGMYYSTVVPVYIHPSIADRPYTGQGLAVSHYAGNSQIFAPNTSLSMRDITDGMTSTVLAGEVAAGFKPWGDPGNLRDPAAGLSIGFDTFGGPSNQQGTQFLMGDGSVRFLTSDVSPDLLEAIATPHGNDTVPEF